MMRTRTGCLSDALAAIAGILITGEVALAQTILFGPNIYTRTAGPPNQFTAPFPVPAGATAPYTLHLVNGHADVGS